LHRLQGERMELVYLWVKDYKNIHKQGFNFSPRFECHYDEDKNELTIDENDNYIENFFGDNINVTAIVGKNGSGKSSIITLLEHIESYPCELSLTKRMPFIILFYINGENKGFTNIKGLSDRNNLFEFVENPHNLPPTHEGTMGRGVYKYECTFSKYFSFLTLNSEMPYPYEEYTKLKILRNKTIDYSQSCIADLSIRNAKDDFTFELTTFMLFPKSIWVSSKKSLVSKYIEEVNQVPRTQSLSTCNEQIRNILINETIGGRSYTINNPLEAYMINQIVKSDECKSFFKRYKVSTDTNTIQEFYNQINSNKNYDLSEFNTLDNSWYKLESMTKEEKKLVEMYKEFLIFDFKDTKGRRFSDLSHGEKSIYAQHISIYDVIKKSDNTLIALDEPTLSLHPNWQKKYINELINLLQKVEGSYYVILTSHSPFLLSDIPKQNIIFLDKDEDGNCKVVDGLKEKKQTFGANIHTLLSDSFFMEDGLMGEFAKGKIDEVIKLLNQDKLDEKELKYCEQIISIIGEPIVKNQLQRMLDSKRLKKVDEIDKIYEEIDLLKHRIEILRKD